MFASNHRQSPALLVHKEVQRPKKIRIKLISRNVVKKHDLSTTKCADVHCFGICQDFDIEALSMQHLDQWIAFIRSDQDNTRPALHLDPLGGHVVSGQGIMLGQDTRFVSERARSSKPVREPHAAHAIDDLNFTSAKALPIALQLYRHSAVFIAKHHDLR
jgi:hypothetical protein